MLISSKNTVTKPIRRFIEISRMPDSGGTSELSDDSHTADIAQPMKKIQTLDEINDRFKKRPLFMLIIFFTGQFLTAILVYHLWTGWTVFEAFYYAVITLETIGKPRSNRQVSVDDNSLKRRVRGAYLPIYLSLHPF